MNVPTTRRQDAVFATLVVAALLSLLVGSNVAAWSIGRYYREQEQTARCQYLGRLLAAELNQPAAQEIIAARCLQAK